MLREKYDFYEFLVMDWQVDIFKALEKVLKEEEKIISWNDDTAGLWLVELKVKKNVDEKTKAIQKKVLEMLIKGFNGTQV